MSTKEIREAAIQRLCVDYLSNPHDKSIYLLLQGLGLTEEQKERAWRAVDKPRNKTRWKEL